MTHDLSSALCGQSNEKQRLSFFLLSSLPPGPYLPVSLLSASNCNLSLDPEPGVQIRDC